MRIPGLTLLAGFLTLLVLPLASAGQTQNVPEEVRAGVNRTLGGVNEVVRRVHEAGQRATARRAAAPRQATPGQSGTGYVPPLHGQNPHGQGTPATIDLPPSSRRPLPADPAGGNGEIVVVGRSRGEQNPDGSYHGHITIAALFGNEVVGVDTTPGQTRAGPLEPLQQGLLTPLCNATQQGICLTVLRADSSTNANGSTNSFAALNAAVGGPTGINASVANSNGNISQDGNCQTAHGDSSVAAASVGTFTADVIGSSSDSRQCATDTTPSRPTNSSRVVNLGGQGLVLSPLIPPGCAAGTPNTPALIPILLPAVCNADDSSGAQAAAPYGVREGFTTFVLNVGTQALLKLTTGASESRAARAAAPPPPREPPDDRRRRRPPDDRGPDGAPPPGGGGPDGGPREAAPTRGPDALPFTGTNVVVMFLIGSLVLLAGLAIRELTARRRPTRAQRAGMA